MTLVKIKSIFVNSKKKDGTPYVNKNGDNFQMAVLTSESGNKASLYLGARDINKLALVKTWKPGDQVEVTITESNGFKNFDVVMPKKPVVQEQSLEEIWGEDPGEEIPF